MKKVKSFLAVLLCTIMTLGAIPTLPVSAAASIPANTSDTTNKYSSNWQYWSAGASKYSGLRATGCRIVANSKMLMESGIVTSSSFNPDVYYEWGANNGEWTLSNPYELHSAGTAVEKYAKQAGCEIEYMGSTTLKSGATSNSAVAKENAQLIQNAINDGYYVILSCSNHQSYVSRSASLAAGTPVIYDSWVSWSYNEASTIKYTSYTYNNFTNFWKFKVTDSDGSGIVPSQDNLTFSTATDSSYTSKAFINDTNACLVTQVNKVSGATVSKMGIRIYLNDVLIENHYDTTRVGGSTTKFHTWFDLTEECGLTLTPGMTYSYQFYGICNGVEYKDTMKSFTTTGQYITSISVNKYPTKTSYYLGETFNSNGLELAVKMSNGTTDYVTSGFACTTTPFSSYGTATIYISYGVKITTLTVSVKGVAKPASVTAKALSSDTIQVSWSKVSDVDGYEVYRFVNGKSYFYKSFDSNTTTFNNAGKLPSTTYQYKLRAYKTINGQKLYSGYTDLVSCTTKNVAKPTNVTAVAQSSDTIKVTWDKVDNADGYEVYRFVNGKSVFYKSFDENTTSFLNAGKVANTTYYYKMRAYHVVDGKRVYSYFTDLVTCKTPTKPLKPANVQATALSTSTIRVTWDKVDGATGYEVYRFVNGKSYFYKSFGASITSFNNAGKSPNTTYYYKMRSYKIVNGEKIYSYFTDLVTCKTPR